MQPISAIQNELIEVINLDSRGQSIINSKLGQHRDLKKKIALLAWLANCSQSILSSRSNRTT